MRLSNFDFVMLSPNVFISISGCHPSMVDNLDHNDINGSVVSGTSRYSVASTPPDRNRDLRANSDLGYGTSDTSSSIFPAPMDYAGCIQVG